MLPLRTITNRAIASRAAIEAAVRADLAQNGFGDVTPAHSALLRDIGDDGARPSELAAHAGVTRQAITKLVDELERLVVGGCALSGIASGIADPPRLEWERARGAPGFDIGGGFHGRDHSGPDRLPGGGVAG